MLCYILWWHLFLVRYIVVFSKKIKTFIRGVCNGVTDQF